MYLITSSKYQLIKNEIINEDSLQSLISDKSYYKENAKLVSDVNSLYIFVDNTTNQRYFTTCNFLDSCAVDKEMYLTKKCLTQNGGKIYQENDLIIVEHNGYKCIATPLIFETLAKGDISIVAKMNKSVDQYKQKQLQAANKIEIMFKYYNLYKSKLLTNSDLIQWKKVTQECIILLNQMSALPYADISEYYSQIRYKNQCFYSPSEIIDMTMNCKRILGL